MATKTPVPKKALPSAAKRRKTAGKAATPKSTTSLPNPNQSNGSSTNKKKQSQTLSQLLTPKNIQNSFKAVDNLRSTVKNWLSYLQQADVWLDSIYGTTTSLKEAGILEKLTSKKKGKLTTEDFTTIFATILNTPLGGRMLQGLGGGETSSEETPATPEPTASAATNQNSSGQNGSGPQPAARNPTLPPPGMM